MTDKIQIPRQVNRSVKFFSHFTWKDLFRLAVLPGLTYIAVNPSTWTVESVGIIGIAVLLSAVWFLWRPYGQHLDTLLYNAARSLPARRTVQGSDLDELNLGYGFTSDGAAFSIFEVKPTSLEAMSQAEQGVVHSVYQELFNTISFPVTVHSRQQPLDLSEYVDYIEEQETRHDALKQDYTEYLDELTGGNLTATRHFLVIHVEREGKHWLYSHLPDRITDLLSAETNGGGEIGKEAQINELESRCRTARRALDSPSIDVSGVVGRELDELAEECDLTDPKPSATWTTRPGESSEDDEYRRSVYIHEFRTDLRLGWPLDLLRIDGKIDVVQRIEPRNAAKAKRKLDRLKTKLSAEVTSFLAQGRVGTHKLEGLVEDVDWMLNLLADGNDVIVDYTTVITAHDKDSDRCKKTFSDVCEQLEARQIDYRLPAFRTDQAYKANSPLHGRGLDESMMVPAGSAAAGFPFGTHGAQQNGVVHGIDIDDESPVLLNRFSWDAGHLVRMGRTGSGKSYAEKVELLRTVLAYPELDIYVVDPKSEQEFVPLIDRLGGTIQTLDPDTEYRFDDQYLCFDVGDTAQSDIVPGMMNAVSQCYEATTRSDDPTLVVIDEAHHLTETDRGIQLLSKFVREARSTNTAVTLISQNASDFTHRREGRTILDNSLANIFMNHERVPDDVVDYFRLSQKEKQDLLGLATGDPGYSEAVVKVSDRLDTKIRIEATDEEHRIIEELQTEEVLA